MPLAKKIALIYNHIPKTFKGSLDMPSKTPAQHRLMEIAAHTKGGYGGVPQKVGKDFARADNKAGITKTHNGKPIKHKKEPKLNMRKGVIDYGKAI